MLPSMHKLIVPVLTCLLLPAGACLDEGRSGTVKVKASPVRPKTRPVKVKAPELPRLARPRLPAAERIVDLFYTANIAAEAEPCG